MLGLSPQPGPPRGAAGGKFLQGFKVEGALYHPMLQGLGDFHARKQ